MHFRVLPWQKSLLTLNKSQISDYEIKKGSTDIKEKGVLNDKHSVAIITFKDIENWGDITVDYMPDAINKPEIKYITKN